MDRPPWFAHMATVAEGVSVPAARSDSTRVAAAGACDCGALHCAAGSTGDHGSQRASASGVPEKLEQKAGDVGAVIGCDAELAHMLQRRQLERARRWGLRRGPSVRRAWSRQLAAWVLLMLCLSLIFPVGGEDDSAALEKSRMMLADQFDLRKHLSGESSFPSRYRSGPGTTGQCCGGDRCSECAGEKVGNLDAVRLFIEKEIRILRRLGCSEERPCRIADLMPRGGPVVGGTEVTVTVAALDLDAALQFGPLDCWIRMGLEEYVVRPTTRVGTNQLKCTTPPSKKQMSQITLHTPLSHPSEPTIAITAGETLYQYYDATSPLLESVVPSGAPQSPGGTVVTITGSDLYVHSIRAHEDVHAIVQIMHICMRGCMYIYTHVSLQGAVSKTPSMTAFRYGASLGGLPLRLRCGPTRLRYVSRRKGCLLLWENYSFHTMHWMRPERTILTLPSISNHVFLPCGRREGSATSLS